ncbi:MAG: SDR family NAD(P)-dependent oxidoreductase, partial [Myxococcales bacterium]|nr:SDR family NAD(P)-dependent oxidoreductase [Myxococcales bacterium]
GMGAGCVPDAGVRWLPSLRRGQDDRTTALTSLGRLYLAGAEIHWAAVTASGRRRNGWPTYAFQRTRHWFVPPGASRAPVAVGLLGQRHDSPGEEVQFVSGVSGESVPYLADHVVFGELVVPAAHFVASAVGAADAVLGGDRWQLRDLVVQRPLVLQSADVDVHLVASRRSEALQVRVASRPDAGADWVRHAEAAVAVHDRKPEAVERDALQQGCPRRVDADTFFDAFGRAGIELGPSFRWIEQLWLGEEQALARLVRPPSVSSDGAPVHATLLDAVFQTLEAVVVVDDHDSLYIPIGIRRLSTGRMPDAPLWCHARLTQRHAETWWADLVVFDEHGQVVAEVEGLQLKRATALQLQAAKQGTVGQRTAFAPTWVPAPRGEPDPPEESGAVQVVGSGALATALTDALAAQGAPRGVVCVVEPTEHALGELLERVQALAGAELEAGLWLVTAGAQPLGGEAPDPRAALVWGLGRVVQQEHPELSCRLVDLSAAPTEDEIRGLLREIRSPGDEGQLALRGDQRSALRLQRVAAGADTSRVEQALTGGVLITGGLGGLGLALAERWAAAGARHLVLVGRSSPQGATLQRVEAMQAGGCEVWTRQVDVTDRAALSELLDEIDDHTGLRGVVHAAGVIDDGVLAGQTAERMRTVCAPKVQGAEHLDALTCDRDLDLFVLFSSVSAVLGPEGQGAYAAANAHLDALAHARAVRGLAATSVGLGPFAEVGMAADDGIQRIWAARGVRPWSPSEGFGVLEGLVGGDSPHVLSARLDAVAWARSAADPARALLVESLVAVSVSVDERWSDELLALDAEDRRAQVAELVTLQAQAVMGLTDALAVATPLRDLGMDSLMAVELRNALSAAIAKPLPATLVFDHPTVDALTTVVLGALGLGDAPRRSAVRRIAASEEPIAIVGMGCRLPGGVHSPEDLWRLVTEGIDAVGRVPAGRWDVSAVYDPDPGVPGKTYCRDGGFLDDLDGFDAGFFGISPREAVMMDPQQRLLLEVTWEALERAGIAPADLVNTPTGVFVGISTNDYGMQALARDPGAIDAYTGTGNLFSVAAGRLSYVLGVQGPAMSVDTACSSSLVALHLACASLRSGESDLAVAAGVNALVSPELTIYFSKLRALSPDGRCKAFDAGANGYVRGEGCGSLVLQRLSDAERSGAPILAVVRGTAVNHDGRSNGLTAPNGPSQVTVIRQALSNAGVQPDEVGYVEAHGTGTSLGDPIEVGALGEVMAERSGEPLQIGSLKSNIGHLEAAAGVASVIKAVQTLRHGQLPPSLHVQEPNPLVDWEALPVEVVREGRAWSGPRVAGVSSFGISGTNAHVVLGEAPSPSAAELPAPTEQALVVLGLSARSEGALRSLAGRYAAHLRGHPEQTLAEVAYTAGVGRSHFEYRLAMIVGAREHAIDQLSAFAEFGEVPLQALEDVDLGEAWRALEQSADATDRREALQIIGRAYVGGATVSWERLNAPQRRVVLPTYAFERTRHWHAPPASSRPSPAGPPTGSLLGVAWDSPGRELHFVSQVGASRPPYLAQHEVFGDPVAPAAYFVSAVLAAARHAHPRAGVLVVEHLAVQRPLVLGEDTSLHVVVGQDEEGGRPVTVARPVADGWIRHVRAHLVPEAADQGLGEVRLDELRARCTEPLDATALFDDFATAGIRLGPAFRWIRQVWRGPDEALTRLGRPPSVRDDDPLHPTFVDAWFQTIEAIVVPDDPSVLSIPVGVDRLCWAGPVASEMFCHARITQRGAETWRGDLTLLAPDGRLLATLQGVQLKRATRAALRSTAGPDVAADLLQVVRWEEAGAIDGGVTAQGAWWVGPDGERARGVRAGLTRRGARVVDELGDDVHTVVYVAPDPSSDAGDLEAVRRVLAEPLRLVQTLVERSAPVRALWLVTSSAHQVRGDEPVAVHHASVWGFGRVVQREHPDLSCRLLDLPADGDEAVVDALLWAEAPAESALRGGRSWRWRLAAAEAVPASPLQLPAGGILVTGGLGAVGLRLAEWLAGRGAERVVLVSRRTPDEAAERVIASLREAGCDVWVRSVDVTDRHQVASLIDEIEERGGLAGVVHGAGVLDDGVIASQDWQRFRTVLGPKVLGAMHLDALTRDRELPLFVLVSSVAGVIGSPGQSNYAAANAWLDALAHARRARGQHALSLDLGPVGGEGMAARTKGSSSVMRQLVPLAPSTVFDALGAALGRDLVQVVVMRRQVEPQRAPARRPVALADLRARGQRQALLALVQRHASLALQTDGVSPSVALRDLGLDSLMAVEMHNSLSRELQRPLPATLVFDHPTVQAITDFLLDELDLPEPASVPAQVRAPSESEPIAIVGMGCRLPGDVASPSDLWRLVSEGTDAVVPVPAGRWDLASVYDPDPDVPGKTYSRDGGFVSDVGGFDADFFGISPREAVMMDPQQRLLLEVTWEALERAGIAPADLVDTPTGVFVGIAHSDYGLAALGRDPGAIDAYTGTGSLFSVAAGRLSYVLGVQGPAMSVDTACSSSLVALHLACASLRSGESDLALAAGVNVLASPELTIYFSKLRALSPDGRCKAFGAGANGYVRGEGCGSLVLQRLSDAQRTGATVLAVVRGTAVNHDGRSNGLTAPNGPSQVAVIRQALSNAGVQPDEVGYVEAHGTGTSLGDPIEVGALGEVMSGRSGAPLRIGSLKSNIGHLEAAAGVASVIKVVEALRRGEVAPSLHTSELNPLVPWSELPVEVVRERQAWPGPRVAGVSSFGISGTNAHVVLTEAPPVDVPRAPSWSGSVVLGLSARSDAALRSLAARYAAHLHAHPEQSLAEVAHTAGTGRSHFAHRLAVVADSAQQAIGRLQAVSEGRAGDGTWLGVADDLHPARFGVAFTGEPGPAVAERVAAWWEIAAFRQAVEACRAVAGAVQLDEEPSELFALQWGQFAAFRAWGLLPDVVVGEGVGARVAACVRGELSLADALAQAHPAEPASDSLPEVAAQLSGCVELGPEPTLGGLAPDLASVAALYVLGMGVDWRALLGRHPRVQLPTYPFEHEHHWLPRAATGDPLAYLLDHRVFGRAVAPGAYLVAMALDASGSSGEGRGLSGVQLLRPLTADLAASLRCELDGSAVTLSSGQPVAFARVADAAGSTPAAPRHLLPSDGMPEVSVADFYDLCSDVGVQFGPAFRWIHQLWSDGQRAVAQLRAPSSVATATEGVHPAALDAAIQTLLAVALRGDDVRVPFAIDRVWQTSGPPVSSARAVLTERTDELWVGDAALLSEDGQVRVWLQGVRMKRTSAETMFGERVRSADLWRTVWTPEPAAAASAEPAGPWVVCGDSEPVRSVARSLRAAGQACQVAPLADGVAGSAHVVYVASTSTWSRAVHDLLRLAASPPRRLSVVMQRTSRPEAAAVGGLVRAWMAESGGVCRLVNTDDLGAEALVTELKAAGPAEVWLRGGERRVPLLEALSLPAGRLTIDEPGTALITGGTGALGRASARLLAERGVRDVVLVSRSEPDLETQQELATLQRLGVSVHLWQADVSQRDEVDTLLELVRADLPELRWVIHCAGVLDDGVLAQQEPERVERVMAAKARGALHLHEATRELSLRAFVLFSSAAGLLRPAGQGSYAAANAVLDALASHRRSRGLPAVSIQWGPWAAGMVARMGSAARDRLAAQGLRELSVAEGTDALERILAADTQAPEQVAVVQLDLERMARLPQAQQPPMLTALLPRSAPVPEASAPPAGPRQDEVRERVHEEAARVLRFTGRIALRRPLHEVGLDSLMAVELRNALVEAFGVSLPSTVVFDHPSVQALADVVVAELQQVPEEPETPSLPVAAASSSSDDDEAVAIVAMACRYPGGVDSPEALWRLCMDRVDAITEIPPDRWDVDAYYDPDPDAPGKMVTRFGGFVDGADRFDAPFFGATAAEARMMDPQQRLLLEVTWEALERAGIAPSRLEGTATGVYVGLMSHDYLEHVARSGEALDGWYGTGNYASVASGRLSYLLGVHGPSLTVDTACSSSLVTLHLARQSLLQGECDVALAGGVTLVLTPSLDVFFSRTGGLSPTGRCRSFDAAADGVSWSEGCGMLVLKRLRDAERDGDRVLALVRGSAVNQDGRSQGLTAPNGPSQRAVIRQALASAGRTAADLDYVEAHGTGTPLGDPIEVQALGAVLGERPADRPLWLGAVKSNLGHTQAAAGVANVIKVVQSLQEQQIPPSLHFEQGNPKVDWGQLPLRVVTDPMPWGRSMRPRLAGVSSFGISGTNAHVIVEEAPAEPARAAAAAGAVLLPLSAKTPSALVALGQRLSERLSGCDDAELGDASATLGAGRSHFSHRAMVVA